MQDKNGTQTTLHLRRQSRIHCSGEFKQSIVVDLLNDVMEQFCLGRANTSIGLTKMNQ
jgi:hypothetical protein